MILFVFDLEKEITTYSSILACRIPWTEEPGGLQSMELPRVRHDRATSLTHSFIFECAVPRPSPQEFHRYTVGN